MSAPVTLEGRVEVLDGRVTILVGDVMAMLAEIPDESVDCVVTSPPYWGLRDYDVDGQIGMEPTLGEHLAALVAVFEEIRRVLKPAGTVWLNYGDCYATHPNGRSAEDTKAAGNDDRTFRDKPMTTVGPVYGAKPNSQQPLNGTGRRGGGHNPAGPVLDMSRPNVRQSKHPGGTEPQGRIRAGGYLKPKELCLIPQRLIIALQDAGWFIRSDITWGKPNAMPDSSGPGRPAIAHEKIYLLSKDANAGGWWRARDTGEVTDRPDLGEIVMVFSKEKNAFVERNRWRRLGHFYNSKAVEQGQAETSEKRLAQDIDAQAGSTRANGGVRSDRPMKAVGAKRSSPATERGEKGRRRAVTPRHEGHINHEHLDQVGRGEGRLLRTVEPAPDPVWTMATAAFREAHFATFPPELVERCLDAGCLPGGHVLDPFGGSGTTGLVAVAKGRTCDLIELNPDYAAIAVTRLTEAWQGSVERTVARLKAEPDPGAGPLFESTDQAVAS